jgi:alkylated DNA repair dioxygenase AlkB
VNQQSLYPQDAAEAIPLPGAELVLLRAADLGELPAALLAALIAETPWRQESITLYGKTHLQPRLVAWYGDRGATYRYSGKTYRPNPWTSRLADLRARMEALAQARFNSVLLNYYRDNRDSMGLHADDEPELGARPVIASLSLGEERILYFRHKRESRRRGLDLPLPDGSVLLMRGDTQANWKHGMRKLSRPCGPRVNLTFRWVSPPAA